MTAFRLFQPDDDAPRRERITRRYISTVHELILEYLARTESQQGVDTFTERRAKLLLFDQDKGELCIEELIPDDLEGWIESHAEWASDWTRLRIANTIKRPFGWAMKKGLIKIHPFASVSYPEGKRGRPMEIAHFRAMLRATDPNFRRVLMFMSMTGCRPCELSALEWTFIDAIEGTATLYVHKTENTRKDRAPRVIYLTDIAVKMLLQIRRHRPLERFVFTNQDGNPWCRNSLDCRIWRLREKLGIPRRVKLYGVRHAWATDLAKGGVGLAALAELLGHTTVDMARYYVHLAGQTEHLRKELHKGLAKRNRKN